MNLLPDDVRAQVLEPVFFSETLTQKDVKTAVGRNHFRKLLTKDGRLTRKVGEVFRDCTLVCANDLSERDLCPNAMGKAQTLLEAS